MAHAPLSCVSTLVIAAPIKLLTPCTRACAVVVPLCSGQGSDADAGPKRPSSTRSNRRASSALNEGADGEGGEGAKQAEKARGGGEGGAAASNGKPPADSIASSIRRSSAAALRERDRGPGGAANETLQTQLLRMPYYLFQGLVLITFVTDKVTHIDALSDMRKQVMVGIMALSIGNFFSSTTTARSNIVFRALRAVCDSLNILHALVLILLSVWASALPASSRSLAAWLSHFPSLANFSGISPSQVGPMLGTFNLITGFLRLASTLAIDTHPLPSELPLIVIGLVLLSLIPANVSDSLVFHELHFSHTVRASTAAGLGGGSGGGQGEAGAGRERGADSGSRSSGGESLLQLGDVDDMPWCSCHVLTTCLVVGLVNLTAPPLRALGAPLLVSPETLSPKLHLVIP